MASSLLKIAGTLLLRGLFIGGLIHKERRWY
jgi:hypothetical protein